MGVRTAWNGGECEMRLKSKHRPAEEGLVGLILQGI